MLQMASLLLYLKTQVLHSTEVGPTALELSL